MIEILTLSQKDIFYYTIDENEGLKIKIKGLPKVFTFTFDQVNEFLFCAKGRDFYITNEIDNYKSFTFENWIMNNTTLAPCLCEFIAAILINEKLIIRINENIYRQNKEA